MEFPTCFLVFVVLVVIYIFQSYSFDLGGTMNILFVGFSVDACPRIWWFHVRRYDDLSDDIFSLFSWIKLDWLLVQPQLMMQAVGKQFNLRL